MNKEFTNNFPLICWKYNNEKSLIKIFPLLQAYYNFSPSTVSLAFNKAQINSLKKLDYLIINIIQLLVYFILGKHFLENCKIKKIKNKNLNKRGYEIIKNIEILCFMIKMKFENNLIFLIIL